MVIRIWKDGKELGQLTSRSWLNASNRGWFCALILAVAPILQHYRGLVENAGYTVLMVAIPFLLLELLDIFRNKQSVSSFQISAIIPLLIFELYCLLARSVSLSRILYIGSLVLIFICIASNCVNMKWFLIFTTTIIRIALVLLIVQYISRYVFHHTLNFRPLSLLVDQDAIWIRHTASSYSSGSSLYRPAAFFLEPSHLFLYSFPVLCLLVLSPQMTKWRRNKAIEVTVALLMSTSGFSIVLCLLVWGLYFLVYRNEEGNKRVNLRKIFSGNTLFILILLIIVIVLAYLFIPIFQKAVNRILTDTEGTNAISGRINRARQYIKLISGKAVLFGSAGVTSSLEFNLGGFFATYIRWGIIGLVLTYWYYGQGVFKLKREYYWISIIILVISLFTAHTHGTFYMMYFVIYLANGYSMQASKREGSQYQNRTVKVSG